MKDPFWTYLGRTAMDSDHATDLPNPIPVVRPHSKNTIETVLPGDNGETDRAHELFLEVLEIVVQHATNKQHINVLNCDNFRRNAVSGKLELIDPTTSELKDKGIQMVRDLATILVHLVAGHIVVNLKEFSSTLNNLVNLMKNGNPRSQCLPTDVRKHNWVRVSPDSQSKMLSCILVDFL